MFAVVLGGKVVHVSGNMVNKWRNMQTVLAMPVLYLALGAFFILIVTTGLQHEHLHGS
jgi:hypothetical protein